MHQDDRLGSSPRVKAEVQGLGAVKVSHWGVQSMEVSVLIWVSEHHFGRRRKGEEWRQETCLGQRRWAQWVWEGEQVG